LGNSFASLHFEYLGEKAVREIKELLQWYLELSESKRNACKDGKRLGEHS
jgi:hypothetical protein